MKYASLIIIFSICALKGIGQSCKSAAQEKYEKKICEIETLISETFSKVQKEFGPDTIKQKIKKLNKENCEELLKMRNDLIDELYNQGSLDYNVANHIEVYVNSITVYVNSLRLLTETSTFDVFQIAENNRAYQMMEISKLKLINLLWEKKRNFGPGVSNEPGISPAKFHVAPALGFFNSSIKSELEQNFNPESIDNISFKKLNYSLSIDYSVTKKIRVGAGISSMPETGANTSVINGRLEERMRGTALAIQGTYLVWTRKNQIGAGVEAGISFGVEGSFISSQRIISTSDNTTFITQYNIQTPPYTIIDTNSITSYNQETYSYHTTSLGLIAGAVIDIYLNKYVSIRGAVNGMFNTDVLIPKQYYNINDVLEEQNLSYSSFSFSLGIAIHL